MKIIRYFINIISILYLSCSCFSVSYTAGGITVPPEIKTVSVQYFPNRATLIEPSLSQTFTDSFKDFIEKNTKLRIVNTVGDIDFSGEIKNYGYRFSAIAAGDVASQSRFTITVRVKFTNHINQDDEFDSDFSSYRDYETTVDFNSIEAELTEEIIEEIIDQVFNKAFVNW